MCAGCCHLIAKVLTVFSALYLAEVLKLPNEKQIPNVQFLHVQLHRSCFLWPRGESFTGLASGSHPLSLLVISFIKNFGSFSLSFLKFNRMFLFYLVWEGKEQISKKKKKIENYQSKSAATYSNSSLLFLKFGRLFQLFEMSKDFFNTYLVMSKLL